MDDEFDKWNTLKKKLHNRLVEVYANQREIWWCSFGFNVGTELYGKNDLFERPVLVLKVYNKNTLKVVPLTTKPHKNKYFVSVEVENIISFASLTQVKTISTKRLSRKIGRITTEQFSKILKQYVSSL